MVRLRASILVVCLVSTAAFAQVSQKYTAPNAASLGSQNTATADMSIPRPNTTPCVVQLFSDFLFENFNAQSFSYAPPAECPGPWAKVVLEGDFAVTAGVQYDRTGNVWFGPVNVYFGTTPEPSPTFGPTWHFESDLTDYSALFTTAQNGTVDLGNLVNSTYTGIISGSMFVQLYPLERHQAPPATADLVLGMSAGSTGGTVALAASTDTLSQTFTLPQNVEQAYLDVFSQSQSNDEFWYSCAPNDVAAELENCGNTGFRETEITVDGQPAGVAPVYPWIYTGGVDPFLWTPSPGVQTLNFAPYRVDLTPFAGVLSNGQPHTVALSVYNADNYFSATATLLLYLDHGAREVTGAVTQDTIGAGPNPVVNENLNTSGGNITGTVSVVSQRQFTLAGYVKTSHGKISTTLNQAIAFSNVQQYDITSSQYLENINQSTFIRTSKNQSSDGAVSSSSSTYSWPLVLDINYVVNSDGSSMQTTTAKQSYQQSSVEGVNGRPVAASLLADSGAHADTLNFDSSGNFTGNTGQSASQNYFYLDPSGHCYEAWVTSSGGAVTGTGQASHCGF